MIFTLHGIIATLFFARFIISIFEQLSQYFEIARKNGKNLPKKIVPRVFIIEKLIRQMTLRKVWMKPMKKL